MRDQWIRGQEGVMLMFSLTSRESYDYIRIWYELCQRVLDCDTFPCVLVGNKCDVPVTERAVSSMEVCTCSYQQ